MNKTEIKPYKPSLCKIQVYVVFFLATFTLAAGQLSPTAEETYMLELINRLRFNPEKESQLMLNSGMIPKFVDTEMFMQELKIYKTYQPLFFDRRMIEAARQHTAYQIKHGQGHFQKEGVQEFTGVNIKNRLVVAPQ